MQPTFGSPVTQHVEPPSASIFVPGHRLALDNIGRKKERKWCFPIQCLGRYRRDGISFMLQKKENYFSTNRTAIAERAPFKELNQALLQKQGEVILAACIC